MKRSHLPWVLGALGWGLALALCAAFGRPWKAGSPGGVAACATTAMLVGFGLAPPVRRFLARLPGAHRAVLFAVIAALVFGHTFGSYRATYPFVRWDMFTWVFEPRQAVFHELVGIRADGTQVPLNFARIAPSLHGTFYWALESWGEHARDEARYGQIYSAMLGAFGERYNARHPDDPLRAVATVRGVISLRDGGALDVRRESFWRVGLERGERP